MIPAKLYAFLSIYLFSSGLNLHSQNESISRNFISNKDIFGTRLFIENKSQFDKRIKSSEKIYYSFENGQEKIYFTAKGLIYKVTKKQHITHEMHEAMEHGEKVDFKPDEIYFIEMNWLNANSNIQIAESEKQSHYITYGGAELNSNTFKKITYRNVYNGIDFEYTIPDNKEHGIKYNVIVHPGADPDNIKMVYSGDVKKITLNPTNDLIIKTPADNITEHAPVTFDEYNQPVASSFILNKNTISFKFPKGYDTSKTLIIDPWVTIITTLSSTNYGFDVDFDFDGNVFVYGGSDPFKVAKYDPAGTLLWTFSGTLASPSWTTGGYPGNFVVNKSTGKCYIGQGYNYNGTTTIRISNTGNYDNFITAANPDWNECWDMGFHCATGNIYAFGGGQSGNLAAGIIDQVTASVLPTAFFPDNPIHGQDIASHAIDNLGNVFVYYSQGYNSTFLLNNRLVLLNTTLTGVVWNQPSTYLTLTECQNKSQYIGAGFTPGINSSNGFNCLAVNSNYLFFYDGLNLAAYNKATGIKIGSTTVTDNITLEQGGIAVDDCNTIYIGGNGNILSYNFNGSSFIANPSIPLGVTKNNKFVYDIRLDKASNLLYVSGSGFVGTYSVSSCNNSISNNLKACAGTTLQMNAPPSSSYSWSGPAGFTSIQQNPILLNTTAASAGTYSVILSPNFCSASTLATINLKIDSLNVSISANPYNGYAPLSVDLNNTTVLNNVAGIVTANWNYGNGISMNNSGNAAGYASGLLQGGNTIYRSSGSYTVNLRMTQKTGTLICIGTASAVINVELPSQVEIPNTFTPNGDGVNDDFILLVTSVNKITCQIYDRWGVKVYDVISEKGNIKWDGRNFSGKDVPAGTYFYILTAEGKDGKTSWVDENGNEIKQNGTISLFR